MPEHLIADALRGLPLLAPDANQFARIAIALERRKRARRVKWIGGFALAAALALAAILPFRAVAPTADDTPATIAAGDASSLPNATTTGAEAPLEAQLIARNQWLEAMVRAQGEPLDAGTAYASAELEDLIGMVDVAISSSDERERREALWERRLSLMQELASVRSQGLAVVPANEEPAFLPANYRID